MSHDIQKNSRSSIAHSGPRHMKSGQWKTYRTRFLVKAKQLSSNLSFIDPLGRQHCGRKGDYLVESSDGVVSIAPRQIFEDIYVPMSLLGESGAENMISDAPPSEPRLDRLNFEALDIQRVQLDKSVARQSVHRKLPQPYRDRRTVASRQSLM